MPNWMPSLYPGGRARLIPRRTSFNASRRSAGSAVRYLVTVDAGMEQVYQDGFCHGNRNVRIRPPSPCIEEELLGNRDSAHGVSNVAPSVRLQNWGRTGGRTGGRT